MATPSDEQLRSMVEARLREMGCTEPPISIDVLAMRFGVPIRACALPPWFTAALIYEDGMPAVLMNTEKTIEKRRAALAHLLGHLLYVISDPSATYHRDAEPHREADFIANELEMPSFLVRDQAQKWFNDYRYLAGLFGVDEGRMFEAMRQLGIIQSHGVTWDY